MNGVNISVGNLDSILKIRNLEGSRYAKTAGL